MTDYGQLAEQSWPEWARTHLGVGSGGLVAADGRRQRNDWGVPDSFEWELTFRDHQASTRQTLMRAVERACEFPPGQALTSQRVTAHYAVRGTTSLVPTTFDTDCTDDFRRLAPWLGHLERHPYPPEVRAARVSVLYGYRDFVRVYVSASDGTGPVARRLVRLLCGAPARPPLSVDIRSSEGPWAVAETALRSQQVHATECGQPRQAGADSLSSPR